ncbi:hypothetical protein A9G29_07885 [Gilliamella sp. Fer2-1]|nr:hypothetical protein A9G29_07885 [Gilliamella apicola]
MACDELAIANCDNNTKLVLVSFGFKQAASAVIFVIKSGLNGKKVKLKEDKTKCQKLESNTEY